MIFYVFSLREPEEQSDILDAWEKANVVPVFKKEKRKILEIIEQ